MGNKEKLKELRTKHRLLRGECSRLQRDPTVLPEDCNSILREISNLLLEIQRLEKAEQQEKKNGT